MIPASKYEDLETFLWAKGTSLQEFFVWLKEKDDGAYQKWAVDKLGEYNEDMHKMQGD
jgi:hypothetical protein